MRGRSAALTRGRRCLWPLGRRAPAALAPDSELRSGARGARGGEAGRGERWREVGVPGGGGGGGGGGLGRALGSPRARASLSSARFFPEVYAARPQPLSRRWRRL